MHIGARRVFRLSLTTALSLAVGYGLALSMPFLAPLFGFMLTAAPNPPPGPKGLVGLVVAVGLVMAVGLLLVPILAHYPVTGLLLVLLGLFLANYISLNLGKGTVGVLLTISLTFITMIGQLGHGIAIALVGELMIAIAIAVACQWLVYPLFPEPGGAPPSPAGPEPAQSRWRAARATLIVFPSYLLSLTNPTFFAPIILKSVALGQQASETQARDAGSELLGSTFMAGALAALFWFCLKLAPTLWMFSLWMLAFGVFIASRFYGIIASRRPPSYWQNVMITLIILVGPAVADSANGKDPYQAFAVRMTLFIGVTLYAWLALAFLERLRARKQRHRPHRTLAVEVK